VKRGKSGQEMTAEFCLSVSLAYLKGFLTCCEVFQHGADGFTYPLKEVLLQIFIALKNLSLLVGFEPVYLGPWQA
jgi:hypothetical protein